MTPTTPPNAPTMTGQQVTARTAATVLHCPFDLTVDSMAGLLNAEFVDHPVYDSVELQWFDDATHGTGMLAFLCRRADRLVDYYVDPALRLDRAAYAIGGGTGRWVTTQFEVARLHVDPDGVTASVRFTDVDGRPVEIDVDDRAAGPRPAARLLAPVGSGVEDPTSLMLVHLHGFDLLRRTARTPTIRIEGTDVAIGRLPGAVLHRRHLIKAAAPVHVATVCPARNGPLFPVDPDDPGGVLLDPDGMGITGVAAHHRQAVAMLRLSPPLPPLDALPEDTRMGGTWQVTIDGARMTGGTWHARRRGRHVALALDVTDPWRPPPGQPLLMRIVTRVAPVFRRWPTTYRWTAEIDLDNPTPTMTSRWQRTSTDRGNSYRRLTGS